MKDLIELKSRGCEENYLKKLKKPDGSESKTYVLKVSTPYLRCGELEGGRKFIDPSGGPMIVVGSYLEEAEAVVKSIDSTVGYGYTVTFE
nr:MAG TPA: hypothetical protein [Crassvirales sp.]